MSENKGQDNTYFMDGAIPIWETHPEWGPAFVSHIRLLDKLYHLTRPKWHTQEEREEHMNLARKEVIPLLDRYLEERERESDEAFAVWHKYRDEDGVFGTIAKEYDTLVKDLESRMPTVAKALKTAWKNGTPFTHGESGLHFRDNEPLITMDKTTRGGLMEMQLRALIASRDLCFDRAALTNKLNGALLRTLAENGIQPPPEYSAIQKELESKLFEPDEQRPKPPRLECTRPEEEEVNSTFTDLRLKSLSEDSRGSAYTADFEYVPQPVMPPKKPVPREMYKRELEDLLQSMRRFKCGKFFAKPLTVEENPDYFQKVKEHRDLVTIKDRLSDPQYQAPGFFNDLKLMIENYRHVFSEGSDEFDMANRFEEALYKKLGEVYGEAGQTAKVCDLPASIWTVQPRGCLLD